MDAKMDMNLYARIGHRIKAFRKLNNLTIGQLADHLCKSKATVSKYESGQIAISTLLEIAEYLNCTVYQLIELPEKKEASADTPGASFFNTGIYYCYFTADCGKKPLTGVLEVLDWNGSCFRAQYFSTVEDLKNYHICQHLYHGTLHQSAGYANFIGQNYVSVAETMFLNLLTPFNTSSIAIGIAASLSEIYRIPMAFKILISKNRLPAAEVQNQLIITKEEMNILKKNNTLMSFPTWL